MIEVSVLIMAIAVAVLVAFLVLTLRKVQASLDTANQTLAEAKSAINMWKDDVEGLIVSVKDLTRQVNRQVEAVDPLMMSVKDMGEAVHSVTSSVKEASTSFMSRMKQRADSAAVSTKSGWLDWVEAGVKAYHVVRSAAKVLQAAPDATRALQQEVQRDIQEIQREVLKESGSTGHGTAVRLG